MSDRLKISSDISPFFKYSVFPVVTIGFVAIALVSYFEDEFLVALLCIPIVLTTFILCFVNPYRKIVDVVVDLDKQIFILEKKDNSLVEFGLNELEKYSIRSSIVKLYFRNKQTVSFLLPMSLEYPGRRTVIKLLKEAVLTRSVTEEPRFSDGI